MSNFHRLLRRQIKKSSFSQEQMDNLVPFFDKVNEAYIEFTRDIKQAENILEKSSQELYQANQKLKQNVASITSRLERVVNSIQEVIFEVDADDNWAYLNPAWEKLTGYKVEDCIGRSFSEYMHAVGQEDQSVIYNIRHAGKDFFHKTLEITTKNGIKKWLDVSLRLKFNKEGEVDGSIGTIVDISKLKRVEVELIEARNKETKANKAKDEFLSTMSHEIRTPLNAVIGISHLLLLEDPKESQLENLNALKYSSEHLLGLVNDILDFNKIESGSLELEVSDFSIEHIINGLQSTFSQKAAEKNIRFIIKKDDLLPQVLRGDAMRMSQILTNLVNNAIKFTEVGKVILDIEVITIEEQIVTLLIQVIDTGIGIDQAKHEKIFESFAQANKNTTRKYGGTGLGLAICKKLLKLMNSELKLSSTVGKGSTFSFTLSLGISDKFVEKKTQYSSTLPSFQGLDGLSVLVAEDFKMNIMVIKKFFRKWDIDFEIAMNGQIAVDMATKKNYDLILMDLQMPVMDGYQAAKAIRTSGIPHNKSIPIIALSASAAVDVKNKVQECGMDGHISKPFNPSDLYQQLKQIKNNIIT